MLPVVLAQSCSVESVSPQDYQSFVNAVYSRDGLTTLQDFGPAKKPDTIPLERNKTAIIDEKERVYFPQDFNTNMAASMKDPNNFLSDLTVFGPFFGIFVLNDTLRVSLDDPEGYGYGKGLQERFEGRSEFANFREAYHYLTELQWLRMAFLGSVGSKARIKNVFTSPDFTVTTTCASPGCHEEMYSLFSKYLNIGETAQMVVEFGGGFIWSHFLPPGVKNPIYKRAQAIKGRITASAKSVKDAAIDAISDASDDAKLLLKGDPQKGLGGIDSPNFSASRLDDLPVAQKQKIAIWSTFVADVGRDVKGPLKLLKSGKIDGDSLKTLVNEMPDLTEALKKVGIDEPIVILNGDAEPFTKFLKKLSTANNPKELLERVQGLDQAVDEYLYAIDNASRITKRMADQAPITSTIAGTINDKIAERFGGGRAKTAAAQYTLTPVAYYIAKRAILPHENPFEGSGAYHVPGFKIISAGSGLKLPQSWQVSVINPPKDGGFVDSFVDIIINNGSDPGDAFKSVLTLSGLGIINKVLQRTLHSSIPLFMTEEDSRLYSTGPAIVAFGTATKDCPSCVFSGRDGVATMSSAPQMPFLGSVVENSDQKTSGSTAIVFGHHVNFRLGDGGNLDIVQAKREGRSCYETCPLVANKWAREFLGDNPARAMFIASYLQSLSAVAGGWGIFPSAFAMYYLMGDCTSCVDTEGGYYLHIRAPPTKDAQQIFDATAQDALSPVLNKASVILGSFSETLGKEINAFRDRALAESIRNNGAYVQFHLNGVSHGELHPVGVVEFWSKPKEMVPTTMNTKGSIAGDASGGKHVVFDKENGEMRVNGETVIHQPDLVRLAYVDDRVPGIVVPAWLIVSEFTADPAFVATKDGYAVRDQGFLHCFVSHIPDGKPTTEFFQSIMGRLVYVATSKGQVQFGNQRAFVVTPRWSGIVNRLEVHPGYDVTVDASQIQVKDTNSDENAIQISLSHRELNAGTLVSMIFENGAIYYSDGKLYVHVRSLVHFPGNYVQSVSLSPNRDKNGFLAKFTPTPDAPDDVKRQIDRMNKIIEQMGGFSSVLAQNGAFAIVRDANGNLVLRIVDRNAMANMSVEKAYEILRSVLTGDGKYSRFEVLDGSLQVYRQDDHAILSYVDKATGQRVMGVVKSYSVDENGYVLETDAGKHVI